MKPRSLFNGPVLNMVRSLIAFVLLAFAFGVNAQTSCTDLYAKSGGVPETPQCVLTVASNTPSGMGLLYSAYRPRCALQSKW
jgi:hypothetical protein